MKAEKAKIRRRGRIKAGLCPNCGGPNDRIPRYYCSVCLIKNNERAYKWAENKRLDLICPNCGGDLEGISIRMCSNCYAKHKAYMKDRRGADRQKLGFTREA